MDHPVKKATYLANYVSTESPGHCSVQYMTTKNGNLGHSLRKMKKMKYSRSRHTTVFIAVEISMNLGKIEFKSN